MLLNRRDFLLLSTGLLAGCSSTENHGSPSPLKERTVSAGLLTDYAADGVYTRFRDQGFFLVRTGGSLTALSSICTHRKCKLTAEPDRSYYCKCHGSTFDAAGHVMNGPARRDLPVLRTTTDAAGNLWVHVPA